MFACSKAPKEEYTRADVRRQFGLSERQLRSWEQQDLIPPAESYSFSDLMPSRRSSSCGRAISGGGRSAARSNRCGRSWTG